MNDADLRQLLRNADHALAPITPSTPSAVAARVRERQGHTAVRRRRIITGAVASLVAIGTAVPMLVERKRMVAGETPALLATDSRPAAGDADVAPTQSPPDFVAGQLDDRLAECEQRLAALERGERLARLASNHAAVRDPLADAEERRAAAVLDDADRLRASPADADRRQRLLALLVRLYPNTTSAAVAQQQVTPVEPKERT